MARKFGGIWVSYDDLRPDIIERRLLAQNGTIKLFLPSFFMPEWSSCLSLLSATAETVDYIAVATAGKRSGDMERKVVFGPALRLKESITIVDLHSGLSSKHLRYFAPPTRRAVVITPATWKAIITLLCERGSISKNEIEYLKEVILSRKRDRMASLPDIVKYERDAIAVALDTFGGSSYRQKYLSASPATGDAPFIKALEKSEVAVLEDRMIEHDIVTFPGAKAISRHIVGAVKIETDTGALTIVNANRTKIERTLGVDLVYYNHSFNSFVMVQYKRLSDDNIPVYRPNSDSSYRPELERMRSFRNDNSSSQEALTYSTYRLQDEPFFFKLCSSRHQARWSGQMLPGMYFPLSLWECFIDTDAAKGPQGGIIVGWENANRRFNNTEFTRLLRGGWIGSYGNKSDMLNKIIESELAAGKSVVAAIQSTVRLYDERLRDTHGRFASTDDPDSL